MQIIEVKDRKSWKLFHQVPHQIYKDDPNWICPLEKDVESTFNPKLNKAFADGEAVCYVLREEDGRLLGRIAAFLDYERNKTQPHPLGGIGFFECVPDQACAFVMFEKAEAWLREKGARVIEGPVNFGERDKYWGLLVKGFYPPLFQENYNPPYYRAFFEDWGFIPFEQIITFKGDTSNIPVERLGRVAQRLRERYDLKTEALDYANLDKYTRDFCEAYNASFNQFGHFKPMEPEQVASILMEARSVADPNIMAMAYYEGKPAGFCAFFPDINPLLKQAKGKLNWRTIPFFLLRRALKKTYSARGMGFGVHPDYRSKGIFAVLVEFMARPRNRKRYPLMYLTTIRAHNKDAISAYENLIIEIDRVHLAYRKPLEKGIVIEPFEFMVDV
ncbi:MAG: GNAT family N-acetyltransferase [Phaeodactylibacter sp.]|nr:GNAT family N-acetyltransferase [Phaeodactylibacter sp.]MCB9276476.1 GNAT family N-acetyltransferase [Lewinellaceae bacterium]